MPTEIPEAQIVELQTFNGENMYYTCDAPKTFKIPSRGFTESKISVLHHLALTGRLNEVPKTQLHVEKALRHIDSVGRNVYHFSAAGGYLSQLPNLCVRRLCNKSNHPYTPLDYAAANGHLDQIPKEILERALGIVNGYGYNYITSTVFHGNLNQLPKELLVPKNFTRTQALHQSTVYKDLTTIPAELLTKEVLEVKNWKGNTIMHEVANVGGNIPEIDLELFMLLNTKKTPALATLMEANHLDIIMRRPWPDTFRHVVGEDIWNANYMATRTFVNPLGTIQSDIELF